MTRGGVSSKIKDALYGIQTECLARVSYHSTRLSFEYFVFLSFDSFIFICTFPNFNSFNTNRIKLILKIATPATIEQGIFQLGLLIYFWIISLYGTAPIAAYNIGINILFKR